MTSTLLKYLLRILPLVYMVMIWYQSERFDPESVAHWPKHILYAFGAVLEMLHLFQFGLLYFVVILALITYGEITWQKNVFAGLAAVLYAAADEIHQHFVPFRSMSAVDFMKDVIGVLAVYWFLRSSSRAQNSKLGKLLRKCAQL